MTTHPTRLGKYQVTGVLGKGAMGIVYKGFDPDIRREVALKTMRGGPVLDGADEVAPAERFRNEARAGGRLQHPGIVGVYDFGHDADVDFIAMEYVRGHTLSRYLAEVAAGTLVIDDDDVLSVIGQLLEALHHAHEQGVWHRDIKPSNLILTPEGRLKISDFGIARIESAELTQAASLIGTPMYMAPEQFLAHAIDRRVDIYASGVVLYQLLVGQVPFSGPSEALMYKVVHEAHRPPSRASGQQHLQPYDAIIDRALAKQPARRFANALQFRDALAAAVGRRHKETVSEATTTVLLRKLAEAGHGTGSNPAPHFTAAELALAESRLARHVGPLALVMVKRAARDCADLTALYNRLAEQVTDPAARHAFVQQLVALRTATGAGSSGGSPGSAGARAVAGTGGKAALASSPAGARAGTRAGTNVGANVGAAPASNTGHAGSSPGAGLSPALIDAAQQLLAQQIGPIAKVVVKKAAASHPQRLAFIHRLAQAVDDPVARQRLLDALNRLG